MSLRDLLPLPSNSHENEGCRFSLAEGNAQERLPTTMLRRRRRKEGLVKTAARLMTLTLLGNVVWVCRTGCPWQGYSS